MAAPQGPALWASFVHPAVAALGLALAWWTLQRGLVIRDARVKKRAPPAGATQRHLRLARPAVWILVAASVLGLASAVFVREMKPLHTGHGWAAVVATLGFAGTGLIGRELVKDRSRRRQLHVAFSLVGLGLGLLAAVLGIELLP
jgi:Protein of unknown function (DUF4079)